MIVTKCNTLETVSFSTGIIKEMHDNKADTTDNENKVSSETLDRLADALEQLDETLRDIIILHCYGNIKLTKIAAAMGISYSHIKTLSQQALNELNDLMQ